MIRFEVSPTPIGYTVVDTCHQHQDQCFTNATQAVNECALLNDCADRALGMFWDAMNNAAKFESEVSVNVQ